MSVIDQVLTFSEASTLWGMDSSNLRHAVKRKVFTSDEVRKSGDTWLITKDAMVRVYGERKDV